MHAKDSELVSDLVMEASREVVTERLSSADNDSGRGKVLKMLSRRLDRVEVGVGGCSWMLPSFLTRVLRGLLGLGCDNATDIMKDPTGKHLTLLSELLHNTMPIRIYFLVPGL
jgi:hypothetical protein